MTRAFHDTARHLPASLRRAARAAALLATLLPACSRDPSQPPTPPSPSLQRIEVTATSAHNVRVTWKPRGYWIYKAVPVPKTFFTEWC